MTCSSFMRSARRAAATCQLKDPRLWKADPTGCRLFHPLQGLGELPVIGFVVEHATVPRTPCKEVVSGGAGCRPPTSYLHSHGSLS